MSDKPDPNAFTGAHLNVLGDVITNALTLATGMRGFPFALLIFDRPGHIERVTCNIGAHELPGALRAVADALDREAKADAARRALAEMPAQGRG